MSGREGDKSQKLKRNKSLKGGRKEEIETIKKRNT